MLLSTLFSLLIYVFTSILFLIYMLGPLYIVIIIMNVLEYIIFVIYICQSAIISSDYVLSHP